MTQLRKKVENKLQELSDCIDKSNELHVYLKLQEFKEELNWYFSICERKESEEIILHSRKEYKFKYIYD